MVICKSGIRLVPHWMTCVSRCERDSRHSNRHTIRHTRYCDATNDKPARHTTTQKCRVWYLHRGTYRMLRRDVCWHVVVPTQSDTQNSIRQYDEKRCNATPHTILYRYITTSSFGFYRSTDIPPPPPWCKIVFELRPCCIFQHESWYFYAWMFSFQSKSCFGEMILTYLCNLSVSFFIYIMGTG